MLRRSDYQTVAAGGRPRLAGGEACGTVPGPRSRGPLRPPGAFGCVPVLAAVCFYDDSGVLQGLAYTWVGCDFVEDPPAAPQMPAAATAA